GVLRSHSLSAGGDAPPVVGGWALAAAAGGRLSRLRLPSLRLFAVVRRSAARNPHRRGLWHPHHPGAAAPRAVPLQRRAQEFVAANLSPRPGADERSTTVSAGMRAAR